MTLKELMALLAKQATRMKALLAQDTLTDEEKEEKRTLFTECTDLKTDIEERKAQDALLLELDNSFVDPPAGTDPTKQQRKSIQVVNEPPVYRTFGDQLMDIIAIGDPHTKKDRVKARARMEKAEKRMIAEQDNFDYDLGVEKRAAGSGQTVGVTTEGGGFVQTDFATDIIHKGFNNSAILPKTAKRRLSGNSNSIEIYGIDEDSRAAGSRNGGVVVYTKAELEEYTASKVKFKGIEVKVNKLTGLLHLSDEIMEDASFLEGEVSGLFGAEFAFKTQSLISYDGNGAGEPLAAFNSDCLITVAKETGQAADSIVPENISKMKARATGGAQFFGNRDIIPQLDELYRTVGSNNVTPLFKSLDLNHGILDGVPITFIEQAETIGDKGDLMLADWSQYVTVTKGALKKAESMHLKFEYGQKTLRWTLRFDGQSRWASALTPAKGSNTTSPFIVLAARA